MVNESQKQKMYETLRGQVSERLMRALESPPENLENLSLGELINTLFLVHGALGSTGNFNVTFGAALKMVGREMMWHEPDAKPAVSEPEQRVN